MRTIERTTQIRRDYKRELKGRYRATIDDELRALLTLLVQDEPLPERYQDHPLQGNWSGHRDCHVRPDLILIYQKVEPNILRLRRLGSHAELF